MTASAMYAHDGREYCGKILPRGRRQFEAFDCEGVSIGIFETAAAAARAIFDNTSNDRGRA
jgi:hypothetical protein